MSGRIFAIAVLVVGGCASTPHATPVDAWSNPFTLNMNTARIVEKVPRDQFFEVSVSMFESAEERLSKAAILSQEAYDAAHFGQASFVCSPTKRLYLVRAMYQNGRTGGYHLQRVEDSLLISHDSLGIPTGRHRSALLVCLDFEPNQVFVQTGGGM